MHPDLYAYCMWVYPDTRTCHIGSVASWTLLVHAPDMPL